MKKIRIVVLLLVVMSITMLFTACDESTQSIGDNSTPSAEATQCTHNYTSNVTTEATCNAEGVKTFTCSICNDSYTEAIAATGNHDYTNSVTAEATCGADGVKTFTCSVCNDSYTEAIAATGNHNYTGKVTTEATCTKDGVKIFTCSVCNGSYTEAILATGNHNYTSKVTTEATCTKAGVKTFTCSMCKGSYTESIAATGEHNYTSKVTTEATCTKAGVKTFTCSMCMGSYNESIAATGKHNYTSKVTTEATCTKNGVKTFTCSMCKGSYTESIAAGHKWKNATCTAPKTCSVCKGTEGKALGHTTDNGTCSRCNTVVFKPLEYSGTGDFVITGINIPAGSFSVTLTHTGKKNFISKFYYGDGKYEYQSLTNEIGKYSGTRALYEHGGKAVTNGMIEVRADGAWTVTINKISSSCTTNIKGNGDTVTGLIPINNARNVITLTHKGSSNFIVKIFKENGDRYEYESLTNEIGNYNGQKIVTLKAGYKYFIEIRADGEWTIDFGLGDTLTVYQNTLPSDSGTSSGGTSSAPNKWSASDASKLNAYAKKATDYAQTAFEYAIEVLTVSSSYVKPLYYSSAVEFANGAKDYLKDMKALADSKAELELTNTNGKYSTLQGKIDYAYKLCDEIVYLNITSSNYSTYATKISDVVRELANECLGIQSLSVELMKLFVS